MAKNRAKTQSTKRQKWCMETAQVVPGITDSKYFSPSKWTGREWNFRYRRMRKRCPKCNKMLTLRNCVNQNGKGTFFYPPHKTKKG